MIQARLDFDRYGNDHNTFLAEFVQCSEDWKLKSEFQCEDMAAMRSDRTPIETRTWESKMEKKTRSPWWVVCVFGFPAHFDAIGRGGHRRRSRKWPVVDKDHYRMIFGTHNNSNNNNNNNNNKNQTKEKKRNHRRIPRRFGEADDDDGPPNNRFRSGVIIPPVSVCVSVWVCECASLLLLLLLFVSVAELLTIINDTGSTFDGFGFIALAVRRFN